MEFLGLGFAEWLFVLVLVLLVVGPKDMLTFARRAALLARKLMQSDLWREVRATERELRSLPSQLLHEAGIEELEKTRRELENSIRQPPSEAERHEH